SAAGLADHFRFFAGGENRVGQLRAEWNGEGHMSNDPVAEKSVYAMTGAVDEPIGNKKFQRLVLFFQRSDGGDGKNSFHPELFESINICAEVEFAGQKAMAASVTS